MAALVRPAPGTGHRWHSGQCFVCKKQTKVRNVNFSRPAVPLAACGPHAREWERIPFEQRVLQRRPEPSPTRRTKA